MRLVQQELCVRTPGRGFVDISGRLQACVNDAGLVTGLCHVFLSHTSASLMLCENADPDVLHDVGEYLARLVEDDDPAYRHRCEGPDDMAAHLRSIMTTNSVTIPIAQGRLGLGVWQGCFVCEHRYSAFERRVIVTLQGH